MVNILARIRVPFGFILAGLYFFMAHPTSLGLLLGGGLAFLGMIFRAWATGHIRKNEQLAVTGPYTFTRNPLYLGSFIIGLGFCLAGGHLLILIIFLACFVLLYKPVMRAEEEHLLSLFAKEYSDYRRKVPFFFPTRWPKHEKKAIFRRELYWNNREYQVALGFACSLVVLFWKMYYS